MYVHMESKSRITGITTGYSELFSCTVVFLALIAQPHIKEGFHFVIQYIKLSSSKNVSNITVLLFKSPKITMN